MIWYIIGAILLIIVLVLVLPLHAVFKWDEKISVVIRFLFFKIKLDSFDKKKKKSELNDKGDNKDKKTKPKDKKKHTPEEIIDGFNNAVEQYGPSVKFILRNIRVNSLELYWKICDDNACDCAIRYGSICAALNTAVSMVKNIVKIKKQKYRVFPDFSGDKDSFYFTVDFYCIPIIMVIGLIKLLSIYLKNKSQ